MSLFNKDSSETCSYAALFDIGNGSVGAALVRFEQNKIPTVLYSTRSPISFQELPKYEQLTKSMLSTFLDTVIKLQTEGFPILEEKNKNNKAIRIEEVLCVYTSPWAVLMPKTFTLSEGKTMTVSEKMLHRHLEKETKRFLEQLETQPKSIQSPKLIESKILQTMLNGYATQNPQGKSAETMQVDMVLSAIPSGIYEETLKIINQLIDNKQKGHYHTLTLITFSVLQDIYRAANGFVLINVSSEITDVGIVQGGTLIETASFPKGKSHVLRRVADRFKTVPEEATSLLSIHFAGENAATQKEKIEEILKEVEQEWVVALNATLDSISSRTALPSTLFIIVDDMYAEWFSTVLTNVDFGKYIFSKGSVNILKIDRELLQQNIKFESSTSSFDPFLALEAVFFQKILNSKI